MSNYGGGGIQGFTERDERDAQMETDVAKPPTFESKMARLVEQFKEVARLEAKAEVRRFAPDLESFVIRQIELKVLPQGCRCCGR